MNLRVLIADDEDPSRQRLRQLLAKEPRVEIVGECATGNEAIHAIQEKSPDIVFLDISIPGVDGFGVAEQISSEKIPAIIFVTASDGFASRAFDLNAVDYLLKPFDQDRLRRAVHRARDRLAHETLKQNSLKLAELLSLAQQQQKPMQRVTIKVGDRRLLVNVSEIDWISCADNYSELHIGKSSHMLRSSITALMDQLSSQQFVRINRSILANVDRITQIQPKTHGDALITLNSGVTLVATRTYRREWESLLPPRV